MNYARPLWPYDHQTERTYTGPKPHELPVRYRPREHCTIGIATPREPEAEYKPHEDEIDSEDRGKRRRDGD